MAGGIVMCCIVNRHFSSQLGMMPLDVKVYLAPFRWLLGALWALKWLLPSVKPLVPLEIIQPGELLSAHITLEGLLSSVCAHVNDYCGSPRCHEGAVWAVVSFLWLEFPSGPWGVSIAGNIGGNGVGGHGCYTVSIPTRLFYDLILFCLTPAVHDHLRRMSSGNSCVHHITLSPLMKNIIYFPILQLFIIHNFISPSLHGKV